MTMKNDGVSTLIACEGAAGKVEPKYLAAPRAGRSLAHHAARTLTLSTRTGSPAPRVPGLDRRRQALRGGWNVTGLYTGDAISSPVAGSALTLEFAGNTRVGQQRVQHVHRGVRR